MEKRVLIAFLLSIAVLMGYSLLFPQPKRVAQQEARPEGGVSVPGAKAPEVERAEPAEKAVTVPVTVPAVSAVPEREVTVDTELYTAVLSSRGGVIKSWKLKQYTDSEGSPVEMAYFEDGVSPLLVVPEGMEPGAAGALDYEIDGGGMELSGTGEGRLTLRYASAGGMSIVKELVFRNGAYAFDVDIKTSGVESYGLLMGESFGSLTTEEEKGYGYVGPVTYIDGAVVGRGFVNWVSGILGGSEEKEKPVKLFEGGQGWTGITDKYFLAAVIPEGGIRALVTKGASDWGYTGVELAGDGRARVYAGPKEYDRLKAVGGGLDQAVDFGWFTFIAKPVFVALKFFHGLVGNYGWSIIIITVIIKLLFAPLTHKQQKSMRRMQKLQPMISELKEKFKGDAQRMNMEMMELYKREKVNPLGGCLPMVIQIPVFIALYNVLNNAIELRHAPFMWWLQDLSAKDPYYILPVLMGISMFAMQKMTPSTMDPKQAKIMMIMPVVLTFMFINLPSGLVLYFTLSNILSMAQQLYINKTSEA